MGFTTYLQDKILDALMQDGAISPPATWYVGLIAATQWAATNAYGSGVYVIPSTFNSISGQTGKIFKCTTAGTSGGSEPTWPTTAGGTVTDGGAVWTECTDLFDAGTFTGAEPSGNNYSRASIAANSTNFPNASTGQPTATIENATAITFASPSASWGEGAGFVLFDASTSGNAWLWGAMTSAVACSASSTPSFGTDALQIAVTG